MARATNIQVFLIYGIRSSVLFSGKLEKKKYKCFLRFIVLIFSEVRTVQALLYQRLMEQTCSVELLQKHKQYLDADIKIGEF